MMIEITDFGAPELDIYARYTEGQLSHLYEPKGGIFIAESPKVIQRALEAGCEPISFLAERKQAEGEARDVISRCGDIPVYTAEYKVIKNLTGFPMTRGALCAMRRPPLKSTAKLCVDARRIAVLEDVMNPTNLGAIFRSAAALGMDAVLLTSGCSDPLYRRSSRVSMGTVFQVPWTYLQKGDMKLLRKMGFRMAAMALRDDTVSIEDPLLMQEERLAIVLGTEGNGLSPEMIDKCDYTVRIPMSHGVASLNVAAASAIAFWQLGRNIS